MIAGSTTSLGCTWERCNNLPRCPPRRCPFSGVPEPCLWSRLARSTTHLARVPVSRFSPFDAQLTSERSLMAMSATGSIMSSNEENAVAGGGLQALGYAVEDYTLFRGGALASGSHDWVEVLRYKSVKTVLVTLNDCDSLFLFARRSNGK
ncbi:hypothetical protein BDR04DRAFT_1122573 [Suillus decipiens]|nr:hypothetical protein BDR04DRAFT_1122573 [Suillus decipiens]